MQVLNLPALIISSMWEKKINPQMSTCVERFSSLLVYVLCCALGKLWFLSGINSCCHSCNCTDNKCYHFTLQMGCEKFFQEGHFILIQKIYF